MQDQQPSPTNQQKSLLREKVQSQVVALITKGLEEGTISEDRARGIAKVILDKLPDGLKDEELMFVLPHLDDEFTELSDVVLPIITEYDEKIRLAVEKKVLELIRAKKFTEALATVRQGLAYSSKLS